MFPFCQNGQGGACQFSQNNIGASVSGYHSTISGNEDSLKLAVARAGPVSVAIQVTQNFQSYQRGMYLQIM